MNKKLLLLLVCFTIPMLSMAQAGYSNPKEVGVRLEKASSSTVKVESIAKSPLGNDIWAVTIGSGSVESHPAVAVVAGVDGKSLVGIETAVRFVEEFSKRDDADELLKNYTFYVFPSVNPDATEGYFASVKHQSSRTKSLYDNDRDGLMSEDGVEDLDGNKAITAMIVESLGGEYIKHPNDSRVIVKANPEKGEKGKYMLFNEGIDNDKDGLLNEDGVDGVDLNRNFTYKYKNWGLESGDFPVSEVESRALLDFMYAAYNIHSVVVLGVNDNMVKPEKYIPRTRLGVPTKVATTPASVNPNMQYIASKGASYDGDNFLANMVSDIFIKNNPNSTIGLSEPLLDGNFVEWVYYHFARNSFATTVWSVEPDKRGSQEAAYLKWADANGVKDNCYEWSTIDHPDFEGKKVEVGSLAPYAMYAPKLDLIEKAIDGTINTIADIAKLSPKIELKGVKKEELSKGVYRISGEVVNSGEMATVTAIGERSYHLKYVRVELKLDGQKIVQGVRLNTIPSMAAGASAKVSWIVEGRGEVEVEVGSPQSGYAKQTVKL